MASFKKLNKFLIVIQEINLRNWNRPIRNIPNEAISLLKIREKDETFIFLLWLLKEKLIELSNLQISKPNLQGINLIINELEALERKTIKDFNLEFYKRRTACNWCY